MSTPITSDSFPELDDINWNDSFWLTTIDFNIASASQPASDNQLNDQNLLQQSATHTQDSTQPLIAGGTSKIQYLPSSTNIDTSRSLPYQAQYCDYTMRPDGVKQIEQQSGLILSQNTTELCAQPQNHGSHVLHKPTASHIPYAYMQQPAVHDHPLSAPITYPNNSLFHNSQSLSHSHQLASQSYRTSQHHQPLNNNLVPRQNIPLTFENSTMNPQHKSTRSQTRNHPTGAIGSLYPSQSVPTFQTHDPKAVRGHHNTTCHQSQSTQTPPSLLKSPVIGQKFRLTQDGPDVVILQYQDMINLTEEIIRLQGICKTQIQQIDALQKSVIKIRGQYQRAVGMQNQQIAQLLQNRKRSALEEDGSSTELKRARLDPLHIQSLATSSVTVAPVAMMGNDRLSQTTALQFTAPDNVVVNQSSYSKSHPILAKQPISIDVSGFMVKNQNKSKQAFQRDDKNHDVYLQHPSVNIGLTDEGNTVQFSINNGNHRSTIPAPLPKSSPNDRASSLNVALVSGQEFPSTRKRSANARDMRFPTKDKEARGPVTCTERMRDEARHSLYGAFPKSYPSWALPGAPYQYVPKMTEEYCANEQASPEGQVQVESADLSDGPTATGHDIVLANLHEQSSDENDFEAEMEAAWNAEVAGNEGTE